MEPTLSKNLQQYENFLVSGTVKNNHGDIVSKETFMISVDVKNKLLAVRTEEQTFFVTGKNALDGLENGLTLSGFFNSYTFTDVSLSKIKDYFCRKLSDDQAL